MKKLFITATDTDAGKTHIARTLIHVLVKQGLTVSAFKPISAGCERVNDELINEDALLLSQQANSGQSIKQVNPIAYKEAIAPHIAAKLNNKVIHFSNLLEHFDELSQSQPDVIVTEGAGGWRLPLGNGKYLSEFAQVTDQQVIMIVNMKLGCLNHAVLTYEAINKDGLSCIGWIANCQENMSYLHENIQELTELLNAPLLGTIPFEANIEKAATHLNVPLLLELIKQ